MKRILSLFFTLFVCTALLASRTADSVRVEGWLTEAKALKQRPGSWTLWFARKYIGTPYVGGMLDASSEEKLIVDTRHVDCTTLVEQVVALARCAQRGDTSFCSFCAQLRQVRYIGGEVAYVKRQHYFTVWIDANEREGIVRNVYSPTIFTQRQQVRVNWMTTHTASYKMLSAHPSWQRGIKEMEQSITGNTYPYIPKQEIANNALFRSIIHDGDIIAILTNKRGLDTTHIGLASWHNDGLHLLNASSIHKKVVDEPMLLSNYMQRHPSQIGIRVCRVIGE